jgi:5-methylcytosine-specific restriction endonuclease McrA
MITVLNVNGQELTPCVLERAWREVNRTRAVCPATTVDHIVPSSKGGSDLTQNLLASCMECNTRRGNRSAFSYLIEKIFSVPNHIKLCYRIIKAKH